VVLGGGLGGFGDLVDRSQDPAGDDPPGECGEKRGRGEGDQGVLQQVCQGRFALVLRADADALLERILALVAQLFIFLWA
jgi:hypothetical protein